ncbi:MAG: tripartite tricarboxylate transporter substrate binding protein [Xanthobacteraceae bacterium]|nr:tripartite tricarboxylate transporter substrate binding protein [Xanthobacteraceae bacterium]
MHRWFAVVSLAVAGLAAATGAALAQAYPSQQIRLIVPFAAGGGSDILARMIAEPLSKSLGQPVVVENKPGGGATLGADLVAKSAPDGYTWLFTTAGPQITNPYLMGKLPYDPFNDFTPVAMLAKSVNVLVVTPSLPPKTVRELIDHARANPGKLNYSSSGIGASSHLAGELFRQMAGVEITHVPYRGTGPSTADLLAGHVQMAIDSASTLLPHIKSGGLRALGFATLERQPAMPELAPIADTLPGFDGSSINYISVRAGTPQPIIDRLNKEMNAVISDPAISARMTGIAIMPIVETQADLARRIADEQQKWKRVIERMAK